MKMKKPPDNLLEDTQPPNGPTSGLHYVGSDQVYCEYIHNGYVTVPLHQVGAQSLWWSTKTQEYVQIHAWETVLYLSHNKSLPGILCIL